MKTSLLKTIRQPGDKQKKGKLNYKVVTFAICVVLATALWFMNAFSKKYTDSLTFYVSYQNLPQDKKYPSANSVQVKVNASGFQLMTYKMGFNESVIKLDASQFKHSYYAFTNHTHNEKLQEQLGESIKLLDISPDTVYLRSEPPTSDQN
jgi:hypothetical protein